MYSFLQESQYFLIEGILDKTLKASFDLTTRKGRKFYKFNRQQLSSALKSIRSGKNKGVVLLKPNGDKVVMKATDLINPSMSELSSTLHPDVQRGFVSRSLVDKVANIFNGKSGPTKLRGPSDSIETIAKRNADKANQRIREYIKNKKKERNNIYQRIKNSVQNQKAERQRKSEEILADRLAKTRNINASNKNPLKNNIHVQSAINNTNNISPDGERLSNSAKIALGLGGAATTGALGYGAYKMIKRNKNRD